LPPGVLIERRGSLLFTHFGLSGPAALDVSRAVTGADDLGGLRLVADFLPAMTEDEVNELLRELAIGDGRKQMGSGSIAALPRRLVDSLLLRAGIPGDRRIAELSKVERAGLVSRLNQCEISVTGTRGFDKAEVTAGGVSLGEVDSRDMQSKLVPNLYLAG